MLKFSHWIHIGAGSLLALPAISLQDTQGLLGSRGLEAALNDTVRALEELAGVERSIQQGDTSAVERVLSMTQPAGGDPRERDEELTRLREDVSRLQELADARHAEVLYGPADEGAEAAAEPGRAHVGLDPNQLRSLTTFQRPVRDEELQTLANAEKKSFEPEGYSADPVRHGRACYRAEKYREGLALLERVKDDVEARYWAGRCLERLGHTDKAIEAYQACVDWPEASPIKERARIDLDFLLWKRKAAAQGGRR